MPYGIENKLLDIVKKSFEGLSVENGYQHLASSFEYYSDYNNPNLNVAEGFFESTISGPNLPPWINPFDFNHNFRAALAALEEHDLLLDDHDTSIQRLLDYQYYINNSTTDQISELNTIFSSDEAKERISSIEFRLAKKLEELLHYAKAAKLGGHLLFGYNIESLDFAEAQNNIERIRESLRLLRNRYLSTAKYYFSDTVKISLKVGKTSESSPSQLCNAFDGGDYSGFIKAYNTVFDLSASRELSEFKKVFVEDIGIQVVDKESITKKTKPIDSWHISLESDINEIPMGPSDDSARYVLPKLNYSSVPGSRTGKNVIYSNDYRIKGVDPRRKWQLNVKKKSVLNKNAKSDNGIHDIILHLDLIARM